MMRAAALGIAGEVVAFFAAGWFGYRFLPTVFGAIEQVNEDVAFRLLVTLLVGGLLLGIFVDSMFFAVALGLFSGFHAGVKAAERGEP